jgi:hypothetical protein
VSLVIDCRENTRFLAALLQKMKGGLESLFNVIFYKSFQSPMKLSVDWIHKEINPQLVDEIRVIYK